MRNLKFMEEPAMDSNWVICPECNTRDKIGIHSHKERRYICHKCQKTFAETTGTIFYNVHYPMWVVVLVLTLLAYGCPPAAITAALWINEKTIAAWHQKAGQYGKEVQAKVVCNGQVELGQTQLDELCINTQGGKTWVATGISVFSRLFLWAEVSTKRNRSLIERLVAKVHQAASSTTQAVLFAVDGLPAYPKAILKTFCTKLRNGQPGRPRHVPWPDLHIVQVVKNRSGYKLKTISRRLVHGCFNRVYDIIASSQVGFGLINTAYIERLNATFRSRMPTFIRRTRGLARTSQKLETEVFWSGVVYNFCTVHSSLQATPSMAAGLTEHVFSVQQLLFLFSPCKSLHVNL